MSRHHQAASQAYSDETYLLQSPGLTKTRSVDTSEPGKTGKWRPGVTVSFALLVSHVALGLGLCAVGIYFTFDRDYSNRGWFSLYSFGHPLPLLTARYLNFGLDVGARVFSLTLELLLAFVAIRTATTLWSSSRGVRVSDALTFNLIQVEFLSILMTLQTRASWRIKISYVFSIVCGLIVYLAGSLMFGYENLTVPKPDYRDIQMGGNQMFLGSNISGSYVAPDYSSLASTDASTSPFTSTVLHTLMDLDLSTSNEFMSSFNLLSESRSSLSSRNITALLVDETVSTQLAECQPVSDPAVLFKFNLDNLFVTYVEQNLSNTSGGVNQLREELYTDPFWFTASKYQIYTFIMTHAGTTGATASPADESQVLLLLAYKGKCLPDPISTQFGPLPHFWLDQQDLFFPHNHAVLSCRSVRTISRVVYAPDGSQVEQTSQSFYAKPVLSTLNRLYMYLPVLMAHPPSGQLLSRYTGIGSLLNRQMAFSSTLWEIPSCTYDGRTPVPENSTTLDAISAAWSEAVARLQNYEASILQAFMKQNTKLVSTSVLVATPAYRLAVMPGALFIYGLTMSVAACMLLILLGVAGEYHKKPLSIKSLSVLRVVNELGVAREGENGNGETDKPERSLKKDLGMVRIRRGARM